MRRTRRQRGGNPLAGLFNGLFNGLFKSKTPFTGPGGGDSSEVAALKPPNDIVITRVNPIHAVGNPNYISLENIKNNITDLSSARAHEIDKLIIGIQGTINTITSLEDKNTLLQFVLLKINAACDNSWSFSYKVAPWVLLSLVILALNLVNSGANTTTKLNKCVTAEFSKFDLPDGFTLIKMLEPVVGGNRKHKRSRRYRSRSRRSRA